ncbi:MAG: hypothetical protein Q7T82_21315 [Armatimonadota bacterium]|nr:hypothetical protein [Armatimonadota bacterium]
MIIDARLRHAIEVSSRATVSSVRNFAGEVASVPIYMGFGLVAGKWGYQGGFIASAGVMVLVGFLYSTAFVKRRVCTGRDR